MASGFKVTINAPDLSRLWDKVTDDVLEAIAEQIIEELENSDSDWPVLTGASRDGFEYEIDGDNVRLTNTQEYAAVVEERTGAIRETIESSEKEIGRAGAVEAGKEFK